MRFLKWGWILAGGALPGFFSNALRVQNARLGVATIVADDITVINRNPVLTGKGCSCIPIAPAPGVNPKATRSPCEFMADRLAGWQARR
jgi:hypothetical protein